MIIIPTGRDACRWVLKVKQCNFYFTLRPPSQGRHALAVFMGPEQVRRQPLKAGLAAAWLLPAISATIEYHAG